MIGLPNPYLKVQMRCMDWQGTDRYQVFKAIEETEREKTYIIRNRAWKKPPQKMIDTNAKICSAL